MLNKGVALTVRVKSLVCDHMLKTSQASSCSAMSTASMMACIIARLCFMPSIRVLAPAVLSARLRIVEETGTNTIQVVAMKRTLQEIILKESFLNSITVL